jgi:hypothetical protein
MLGGISSMADRRNFFLLVVSAFVSTVLSWTASKASEVKLVPGGPEKTLFKWDPMKCGESFIPDAPARAFRRADGRISLYATHFDNWTLVGATFDTLRPDCRATMRSSDYASQGMGSLWIEATYTEDGRNIVGLVSQDLTAKMKELGCDPAGKPGKCWLNNIIAVQSRDMGETFEPLATDKRVVASLGQSYSDSKTLRHGYFTTSNIVASEEFFYVFMYAQGEGVQKPGNCLFRTQSPLDPSSWRGWDGAGYNIVPRPNGRETGACQPVAPNILTHEIRSVSFITASRTWVAVFANRLKMGEEKEAVPGFYMSSSKDLLNWNAPTRIMETPTRPRIDSWERTTGYPAIIDPESRSRNFDTIDGPNPVLLYTVHHLKNGQGTMNRDLVYVPLRIESQ